MSIEIVAVGNEVLKGIIVNTNTTYLANRITLEGWSVSRQTTLPDDPPVLTGGLKEALARSRCVIATGGLGPTIDDTTAASAAKLFTNPPEKLPNRVGSAPGLKFQTSNQILILLPGVPSEMEAMFEEHVIPFLKKQIPPIHKHRETIRFFLLSENEVDPILRQLDPNIEVGIYPGIGSLAITLAAEKKSEVTPIREKIVTAFKDHYLPGESLEQTLQDWMIAHQKTLALAESCTGGMIASQLVALPGASHYLLGSLVTYSDAMKQKLLGVSPKTLAEHGAVSKETVHEMWKGLLEKTGADFGLAVSGIAGPSGGSTEKPVGTVYYALGQKGEIPEVGTFIGKGNRKAIILRTSRRLLAYLWRKISKIH